MICKSFPFRVSWRPPNNWLSATWPFDPSTLYPFTRGPLIFDHSSVCIVRSIYVDLSPPIFSLFKKYCLFMRNTVLVFFIHFAAMVPLLYNHLSCFQLESTNMAGRVPHLSPTQPDAVARALVSHLSCFFFFFHANSTRFALTRADSARIRLYRPATEMAETVETS